MLLSLQESVFSRAQTLENWWSRQAPLRMVETLADGSKFLAQDMDDDDKSKSPAQDMDDDDKSKSPAQDMDDDDVEDFSPIRGDESPPHLQAKNAFFASLSRQSVQEGLPVCLTSLSMGEQNFLRARLPCASASKAASCLFPMIYCVRNQHVK